MAPPQGVLPSAWVELPREVQAAIAEASEREGGTRRLLWGALLEHGGGSGGGGGEPAAAAAAMAAASDGAAASAGASVAAAGADRRHRRHALVSTRSYVVGRSRRSDIRVGHKLPVPYISSRNFRLTHALCWPESLGAPAGAAAPALDGADGGGTPWVQAYLEDLSQNGTYVNGQRASLYPISKEQ